ncbi:MAG: hypothetical protein M3Z01_02750 [Thermoproteota archaeon]|nr:hypothetical protein [Thermoproteota archaeon]
MSIYSDVFLLTETKLVKVVISHRIFINDNKNISTIEKERFGHLTLRNLTTLPGNMSVPMDIVPNYEGASSQYFSAVLPFVDSSLTIWTSNGDPFALVYEVSANIIQPVILRHFENSTVKNTNVKYRSSHSQQKTILEVSPINLFFHKEEKL